MFTRAEALFNDVQKERITPARADLLIGMARVRMQLGDYVTALPLAQRADLSWSGFDPESRWAGEAALWLGSCYLAQGRKSEAVEALSRAEGVLARSPIPSDRRLRQLARKR